MEKIDHKLAQLIKNTTQKHYHVIIVFDPNTIQKETIEKLTVIMSNIARATLSKQEIIDISTSSSIISIEHDGEVNI